ncbi:CBS domain-containing protein [Nitrogeniibacter mangrovi]|uniref:CBS domain-containing protein n=1 Tax=Nitrogeniibacter mangrovi TaxID=2016596 RepID=A0A6C1B6G8_9RHOO|nr:CBS domain-containing protein [Nitrogeniibacter mangrovi]QID17880.1 CBS domain-containing protein [Nitrogeniibacter mangrovi]
MPARLIRDVIAGKQIVTGLPELTVVEAAARMNAAKVGAIMVVDKDELLGIFTERDGLTRVLASNLAADAVCLAQVMTPDPVTITPDRPLGHALHMMHEGGYRHVPVVDNGRVVGMVSARDALGLELVDFESELARRDDIHVAL